MQAQFSNFSRPSPSGPVIGISTVAATGTAPSTLRAAQTSLRLTTFIIIIIIEMTACSPRLPIARRISLRRRLSGAGLGRGSLSFSFCLCFRLCFGCRLHRFRQGLGVILLVLLLLLSAFFFPAPAFAVPFPFPLAFVMAAFFWLLSSLCIWGSTGSAGSSGQGFRFIGIGFKVYQGKPTRPVRALHD